MYTQAVPASRTGALNRLNYCFRTLGSRQLTKSFNGKPPAVFANRVESFSPLQHSRSVWSSRRFPSRGQAAAAVQEADTVVKQKELPKNFDPTEAEQRIYQWWEQSGYFKPNDDATGEPFVISMPPPNVTGKLHMGHAMFVTLQDIMVRYARMAGKQALWVPGTDHAGIATQTVVEKMLMKQNVSRLDLGREKFTEKVWEWKKEYGDFITNQLRRLGASCDWSRERFTLDAGLSEAVAEAFVQLYEKGLVYRGSYMVNWSPALLTAVSDLEVEYSEEPGHLYFFKYPVADSDGEFLPVATTRPETILGDTAVCVHPEDPRFQKFIGKECVVPASGGRRIPIIADEYVDMEFGTGALKVTPGHDINDYEIGKRRNLPTINIMNRDATLNANAGKYAGMERFAARAALWADLESEGLAIKKDNHMSRVPRSQRGGEIIEPLVSEQWFVRMEPLAKPALKAVADGDIKIMPERFEKIYNMWLENIKDWCISRQLWWGHRIPVWYVFDNDAAVSASEDGRCERWVVARSEADALKQAQDKYGQGVVLCQEEDVLDTWFSSGLWPFSTLGWPNATPDLSKFYPTQVMETGHDILFFWVARMIMMGIEFTGKSPFHTVYLHGLVRDEKGRKMSKSLGNVIDPLEVIGEYGSDALRFTMATGSTAGQDLNLSMERVVANRNFTNKLWNASKFVLFNLEKSTPAEWEALQSADFSSASAVQSLPLTERWIVSLLHKVINEVTEKQEKFDFNAGGITTYNFFWDEFADWFIEASKARMYGGTVESANTARGVLVYAMDRVVKLVHPFMPYITEELWQALPHNGPALMTAPWPATGSAVDETALSQFDTLKSIVKSVRNARAEYNIEQAKKVGATIVIEDATLRAALEQEIAVINLLAKLDPANTKISAEAPVGNSAVVNLVVAEGVQVLIPMVGLFDVAKELARLSKQQVKLEKELSGIEGRLNNPKFREKASTEVVVEAEGQAAELREKLAMVQSKVDQMNALK